MITETPKLLSKSSHNTKYNYYKKNLFLLVPSIHTVTIEIT